MNRIRSAARYHRVTVRVTALMMIAGFGAVTNPAQALPSYARQTGLPCAMCHTGLPELTPFGREFKLNGYVQGGGDESGLPPIAAMVQAGFTHTDGDQPGANQHFGPNDNLEVDQASLFYGGAIWSDQGLGAFIQATYDGVARQFHWDNTDIRLAKQATLFGSDLTYGFTLNNNPSVQDVWNTTPAWRYPYFNSFLGPGPGAGALIDGGLGQQVAGLGGYVWWNHLVYAEISGYRNLSFSTDRTLGIPGNGSTSFSGVAPYWRFAVQPSWGSNSLELGTFGMYAEINPGRVTSNGTDKITDIGFDAQYQYDDDPHAIGVQISQIREFQNLHASFSLGNSANNHDILDTFRTKASYFYDHTYGINVSYFNISGTTDMNLYGVLNGGFANNGNPNSDGWIFEVNYLPFSNGGPDWWPWLNMRFGLQYTLYNQFDGGTTNFDGAGHNADQNNTLYLYMLTAF
jgi:hypothetical protein